MALAAADSHLVDHEAGLIKLLDPPLQHAQPSAGYIQAYPPGVRENGGQYTHAGVWALMAQARFQATRANSSPAEVPDPDIAYRYFKYLSPAHRSRHATMGCAYGIEPYVVAGDVYTQVPYVGRGGWSWYTGAAAWLHRAAIESIFGLQLGARQLSFTPCMPSNWPRAELCLTRDGRTMRFVFIRSNAQDALGVLRDELPGAQLLRPSTPLDWTTLLEQSVFVVPLLDEATDPPASRDTEATDMQSTS
jgi:cyclic beta-1,2-glucan synthetase